MEAQVKDGDLDVGGTSRNSDLQSDLLVEVELGRFTSERRSCHAHVRRVEELDAIFGLILLRGDVGIGVATSTGWMLDFCKKDENKEDVHDEATVG